MTTKPKDRSGAWADFGTGVFAWISGAAVLGFGAWLLFGQPDLAGASNGDRQTRTSQRPVQYVDEDYKPTDQEIEEAVQESREKVFGKGWSCFYDPTMNENWHDDVRCTNGAKSYRPILLADRGFVTEEDMRAAGQDYENHLNSGGKP